MLSAPKYWTGNGTGVHVVVGKSSYLNQSSQLLGLDFFFFLGGGVEGRRSRLQLNSQDLQNPLDYPGLKI